MASDFMTASECERFLQYLPVLTDEDCWEWKGARVRQGYGRFWLKGKSIRAHRVAYRWHFGDIPKGLVVCHHCDNPACCNPRHLFPGTMKDDLDDMRSKGRQVQVRGEEHGSSVLTAGQVKAIRAFLAAGVSGRSLAFQYGVSFQLISDIKRRKKWAWLPEEP